jgi:cation transport ATPase
MRRGCSVVLLVLGGWTLTTVGILGMVPEEGGISPWVMAAFVVVMAAPFLLIGAWMSPGKRLVEVGLTLMIAAGVGATTVATMAAFAFDPAVQRAMPEPFPEFDFLSPAMIASLLLMAGAGYALWRSGRGRG